MLIIILRNTEAGTERLVLVKMQPRIAYFLEHSRCIGSRLNKICKPDKITYLDNICTTFIKDKSKESIESHLFQVDKLQVLIHKYENEIISLLGIGSSYESINNIGQTVQRLLRHLEDILCIALLGVEEAENMQVAGKFSYQAQDSIY